CKRSRELAERLRVADGAAGRDPLLKSLLTELLHLGEHAALPHPLHTSVEPRYEFAPLTVQADDASGLMPELRRFRQCRTVSLRSLREHFQCPGNAAPVLTIDPCSGHRVFFLKPCEQRRS